MSEYKSDFVKLIDHHSWTATKPHIYPEPHTRPPQPLSGVTKSHQKSPRDAAWTPTKHCLMDDQWMCCCWATWIQKCYRFVELLKILSQDVDAIPQSTALETHCSCGNLNLWLLIQSFGAVTTVKAQAYMQFQNFLLHTHPSGQKIRSFTHARVYNLTTICMIRTIF